MSENQDHIELLELVAELKMSPDKSRQALGAEIKRLTEKQAAELAALRQRCERLEALLKEATVTNEMAEGEGYGAWSINGELDKRIDAALDGAK